MLLYPPSYSGIRFSNTPIIPVIEIAAEHRFGFQLLKINNRPQRNGRKFHFSIIQIVSEIDASEFTEAPFLASRSFNHGIKVA